MKNKVTKKAAGWYEYRGYEIEKVEDHWNITAPGEYNPCDGAHTKNEAIKMVDKWEDA